MSELNTFLSDYVWHVLVELCDKSSTNKNSPHSKWNYLNENFLLDWNKIGFLFEDIKDDEDVLQKPETWYCNTVGKIWHIIHEAGLLLETVSNLKNLPLWELYKWTGAAEDIADLFLLHLQGSEVDKLQVLLHLTALLERSLGNAFLLRGHTVPHLLKDLLNTPEICELLGKVPVTFVQILVGSPKGLNVRNVAWHGFVSPHELHPHLAAIFFILIPSLGNCLTAYKTIPQRVQITHFKAHTEQISDIFPYIDEELCNVSNIISECEYISLSHKCVWKYSFNLYIKQKYGYCMELFLPQLEHILRQLFCDVNGCPQRTLTAESTTYYMTLDEILAPSLPSVGDKTNKIHSILGEGLTVLLNDIFSDMAGPRLRDKVSHGECCLKYLPKDLANHVYCAGLCVSLKAIIYKGTKMKCNHKECGEQCFIKNANSGTQAFLQKLIETCDMYTSRYHVVSQLIQSMKCILTRVDQWSQFTVPTDLGNLELDREHVTNLQSCLFGNSDISLLAISCKISDCINKIRPQTLFRPRSEVELISLLKNITDKIEYTEMKIKECVYIKYKQWEGHTLRSRNRLTFQRMIQVLPDLQVVLLCILGIITSFIQNITGIQQGSWKSYLRFTKGMLRLAENMAFFCTMEKNRWLDAHKIVSEFSEMSVQFLQAEPYLLIYNR